MDPNKKASRRKEPRSCANSSSAMQLMVTKAIGMNCDMMNGQMILNHHNIMPSFYGKYGQMGYTTVPAVLSPRLNMHMDHRPRRRRSNHSLVATMDPVAVARRNERERNRVKQVNDGFDALRKKVPFLPDKKKLSKVEILRCAMLYINDLKCVVGEFDDNNSHLISHTNGHNTRIEGSVSSLSNNSATSDDDCILIEHDEHLADLEEELLES